MQTSVTEKPCVQRLLPIPFFIGIAGALLVCRHFGQEAAGRNPFENFNRFHQEISPESLFYPTASQIHNLAYEKSHPEKVCVIIGGSSVMQGVGQIAEELWSRELQNQLGPDYDVINLAMRGGSNMEFASVAAESLLNERTKVIFVTDWLPNLPLIGYGDGGRFYQHAFWDAYYKGLIDPGPKRLGRIARNFETRATEQDREKLQEMQMRMQFDGAFYFNDLWTTLAYERFSTVWNSLVDKRWYKPRKVFVEGRHLPPPTVEQRYANNLDFEVGIVRNVHAVAKGQLDPMVDDDGKPTDESQWPASVGTALDELNDLLPARLKGKTVFALNRYSPYYVRRLTSEEQAGYERRFRKAEQILKLIGYVGVDCGADCDDLDFADRCHYAKGGGEKMARKLAPEIRELARKLGYEKP